ncbi:ribonuclease H-like domain-containing protein [Tanacetum coccineum]|uniref:Ribonuclease H-like domain-containing protein n=1 Tax=Tanacetum coccineum TaxID=301880 RepID=A0ABQ4YCN7_9ASTR
MKGIKREFSVARTPQQTRVAERKNKTLIEAARTMLADSKLPTTFYAKAVNTACYVQNKKHALSFMRPFGCAITILNTIDHLGSGPNWLFDIHALTKSMNYKPVVAGNQSNGNAGTKACDDAGKARMETIKYYIMLPMWPADPLFSQNSKDSPDAGSKPSGEEEKMDTEDLGNKSKASGKDSEVPSTEEPREDQRVNQEKDASVNSTNTTNTVSTIVNAVGIEDNVVEENIVYGCVDDPNMPELEDIVYSDDDEDVGAEADMNNLNTFMPVSPIPTTRIHKDHPVEQIIGDLNLAPQTRRKTKKLKEHGLMNQERTKKFAFAQGRNKKKELHYDEVPLPLARIEAVDFMAMQEADCGCNSTTEAEYIAASNCCGHVLWIQNQLLEYGYNFMQTKIHIDNESTICIVKNPAFIQRKRTLRLGITLSEILMRRSLFR